MCETLMAVDNAIESWLRILSVLAQLDWAWAAQRSSERCAIGRTKAQQLWRSLPPYTMSWKCSHVEVQSQSKLYGMAGGGNAVH